MKLSKRYADWVIALRADPFAGARLKLTALYVALVAVVVILLSTALYAVHGNHVREQGDREIERISEGRPSFEPVLHEYLENLGRSIVTLDIVTILVAGVLSYLLAGRTLSPIKKSVRDEQEFFANAAHDLRTPLAVMKTEIEVALRSPDRNEEDTTGVMKSSLEEIDRMSAMVEEMFVLASYGSGNAASRAARKAEAQDLSDLVASSVDRMKVKAESQGLTILADDAAPVLVPIESRGVERAFVNVLENALKYTPRGGTVIVRVTPGRSHVDVTVEDSGIGIAASELSRVTDPFYRADAARSSPGSGLGLAIAKRVMTEHRGSIEITSSEGKGTRVRLRFPRS